MRKRRSKKNIEENNKNSEVKENNIFFNEEEYHSWLSDIEKEKKKWKNEKETKIEKLEENLLEDDDSQLLDKIDSSIFEDDINSEELKDICKKSIKNWMLKFDKKGKITCTFIEVWWEKRPSKLFDSFLKAWCSHEQALKSRLQVRTKEFKDWFGDWTNDQENISKIVDENGEPLLVYHGSARRFKEFDTNKIGSTTGDKSGFYFSNNRRVAKDYYSRETGNGWDNIKLMLGLSRKYKPTVYGCFIKALNPYIQDFNGDYDNIGREKIITDAKEKGYDTVILKNIIDGPGVVQDAYVVFHPDQIKMEIVK